LKVKSRCIFLNPMIWSVKGSFMKPINIRRVRVV
jgi:hypothetical protein